MIKRTAFLWIFFALSAGAQTMPQGMPKGIPGGADRQKMMQEAQRMATCMEDVDQSRLEEIGREAEAVSDEIDSLCAAGKEAEALRVALDFSRTVNSDPTVQQVRSCTEGMGEMMADMVPQVYDEDSAAESGGGICD